MISPLKKKTEKVTYAAAISACENRIAWEAALVLLDDAKRDLASLILGDKDVVRLSKQCVKCFEEETSYKQKVLYMKMGGGHYPPECEGIDFFAFNF